MRNIFLLLPIVCSRALLCCINQVQCGTSKRLILVGRAVTNAWSKKDALRNNSNLQTKARRVHAPSFALRKIY